MPDKCLRAGREVAPMGDTRRLFRMTGGVPVVTAPAEIDITNAAQLRAILAEGHACGQATMVVDMAGTRFCDSAGLREIVRAHQRAVAGGGGLRLVIPADGAVLRVFTINGLDQFIPHFASLEQALAQVRAAAGRPMRPGPPRGRAAAPARPPAQARGHQAAADSRNCEQCGAVFVPQREHARFCSAGCRAAWNREHMGDPAVEASALAWSLTAMSEATGRLPAVRIWDQQRAFAAIGEAVWWITMVDATLVRHHPGIYDAVLTAQAPAERALIEQTLAGLRFVRNRTAGDTGLGEVIDTGAGNRRITGWRWRRVPAPALASLAPRGQAWEAARYRAYQAHLAGHTIGQTFGRAVTFLTLTGASAVSITDASEHAARS
jgi:anti-sigma B factor antagonist